MRPLALPALPGPGPWLDRCSIDDPHTTWSRAGGAPPRAHAAAPQSGRPVTALRVRPRDRSGSGSLSLWSLLSKLSEYLCPLSMTSLKNFILYNTRVPKKRETSYDALYFSPTTWQDGMQLHATWRLFDFIRIRAGDSTGLRGCHSTRHCAPSHHPRTRSGTSRSARSSTWQ